MSFAKWGASLSLIAALVACGGGQRAAEKEKTDNGGQTSVRITDKGFQIRSADGETTVDAGGAVTVDKDFPSDVLVYPGAKPVMQSRDESKFTLVLTTKENMAKVVESYREKMTASGWQESAKADTPNNTMLQYKKDDRVAVVNVTSDGTDTQIMVFTGKEKD
ncbi:hypothetical protein JW916_05730 [Candidatus Sumerlaeota bacterium]|nr:hypothetical protein [Candidatus Sumerlaeota bacterium]